MGTSFVQYKEKKQSVAERSKFKIGTRTHFYPKVIMGNLEINDERFHSMPN